MGSNVRYESHQRSEEISYQICSSNIIWFEVNKPSSIWDLLMLNLTEKCSDFVCTRFNQDDKLQTTMDISNRLVDFATKGTLGAQGVNFLM